MPKKKRRELREKLPKRKKLPLRKKAKQESPIPKQASCHKLFTKRAVESLVAPEPGQRDIYRDTRTPHLCLRVTPTAKTFYWEKTVRGAGNTGDCSHQSERNFDVNILKVVLGCPAEDQLLFSSFTSLTREGDFEFAAEVLSG